MHGYRRYTANIENVSHNTANNSTSYTTIISFGKPKINPNPSGTSSIERQVE